MIIARVDQTNETSPRFLPLLAANVVYTQFSLSLSILQLCLKRLPQRFPTKPPRRSLAKLCLILSCSIIKLYSSAWRQREGERERTTNKGTKDKEKGQVVSTKWLKLESSTKSCVEDVELKGVYRIDGFVQLLYCVNYLRFLQSYLSKIIR